MQPLWHCPAGCTACFFLRSNIEFFRFVGNDFLGFIDSFFRYILLGFVRFLGLLREFWQQFIKQ